MTVDKNYIRGRLPFWWEWATKGVEIEIDGHECTILVSLRDNMWVVVKFDSNLPEEELHELISRLKYKVSDEMRRHCVEGELG